MKILSPLDSIDEVEQLAEAGAGEFYCGVLEDGWYAQYPVISINRRPAGKGHFRTFSDLKEATGRSHQFGIPVYFTINEHYYVQDQYAFILKYVDEALDAGVDALIISDYGLMAFLRQRGYTVPIHISTGGTVLNWRAARFYATEFNAENITLPRHLSLIEIAGIVQKVQGTTTTVFVLNSRCINLDGLCTFQHGLAGKKIFPMFRNACMLPYKVSVLCREENDNFTQSHDPIILKRQKIWEHVHVDDHPCGACALFELKEMGIASVKIVGRGNAADRKAKDILFIKKLLEYLDEQPAQNDFRARARGLYQKTYSRSCRMHMCYYPEVLEGSGLTF